MELKWGHWEVTIVTSLANSFISGFCVHFDSMIKKGDLTRLHLSVHYLIMLLHYLVYNNFILYL